MKIAVCFLVLSLAVAAFALPMEEEEETELSVQDFLEYFEQVNQMHEMEKRRPKVGPCQSPSGQSCQVCNLKIANKNNMKRYLVCGGGKALPRRS